MFTRTRGDRTDVSLRDVTITQDGKRRLASANYVTHWKRAEDFGRFWKSQLVETRHRTSWDETCLGRRRLAFACSQRPLWRVPHVLGVGRWNSPNRKIVPLSLCRRTFKLKGNKKVRTWTEKSSSVFLFFEILCSVYICNERPMYISHIHVYGHGTHTVKWSDISISNDSI